MLALPTLCLLCLVSFAAARPADLLLYAPFDGAGDAAFARGEARNLGGLGLNFVPGLRGEALVLRNDCLFRLPGNFRPEQGTVAVWLRPHWNGDDPTTRYVFCIYGRRDLRHSWAVNRWNITCGGGRAQFAIFSQTEAVRFNVAGDISPWQAGEWHHIAATWENINSGEANAEMRLYLDGALAGELTGRRVDVGPTDEVMGIGRDQDATPDYGEADFDDLFIYGRALTEAEIAAAVEAIRAGAPYDVPAAPTTRTAPPDWWDPAWPFRAGVTLPAADTDRQDVFMQCPLHVTGDLGALGVPGVLSERSLRIVEPGGAPLPARIEDGLVEWQAPGVTGAGRERRFHLYFQSARHEVVAPLVAQRAVPDGEAPPEPPPVPDYATVMLGAPWDFADGTFSGIDQWGDRPEYLRNRRVEDGILRMDVSRDPWFIWGNMWGQIDTTHHRIAIDLDRWPVLEMKIRQSINHAIWQLYGRPGTSTSLLTYDFPVRGTGWQRIRIDLREEARWRGVLSAFRIDPTSQVDAHVEIDWVRLSGVVPVAHGSVETLGDPDGVPARLALDVPHTTITAGAPQEIAVTVRDADGAPVAGQPMRVELADGSGGRLEAAEQPSLELTEQARRGLTDGAGRLSVRYIANRRAQEAADRLVARVEFAEAPPAEATVATTPGPPHHYRVEPARVIAVRDADLPLGVAAQLVDEFDNPVADRRALTWTTDEHARLTDAAADLDAAGRAEATWRGDERRRWVYRVRVEDDRGLVGESADICVLPSEPRRDPIVLGPNGYFRKGPDGPASLPLGGFYANWVGLPDRGEEGRRVVSFVEASEEQIDHWLQFLADQGVTSLRFMLRAHTPRGMEPMDIIGRVNMPLFAKVLRYMDLARKHDIRFMLVIHEDYTKPAYYNRHALETFCIPAYEGDDLDALPPHQRRFIRDRELIGLIDEKYTEPDVMACQDQYAREIVGLLKDNPQLFSWEFENEMVNCPADWANHAAAVIRSVDPVTPICASHGGGGLHTADPLWWTRNTDIDFYTYHLYAHRTSTSPEIDYGAAVDILTCYGRMAGVCMMGESAGDEFSRYPQERDDDRRYIMRDIIWFGLVNGNPGVYFWNARGIEVEQFRLATRIASRLDWREWRRHRPDIGIIVAHPVDDDKYYRTEQGRADYAMMGRYTQHYLGAGVDFDFTMDEGHYAQTATLQAFAPPPGTARVDVGERWQVRYNAREGFGEGLAYVRNFAGIRHWEAERVNMYLRERALAPLVVRFDLPVADIVLTATDLDTGEERVFEVSGQGQVDLGDTEHDWALMWRPR